MPTRQRRFAWLLLGIAGALLWAVLALSHGLAPYDGLPFSLVIDGQDVTAELGRHRLDQGTRLLLAGLAVGVGLWLLVALPLALLAGLALMLGLVLLVLLGSVGLPLLALALVLGLLALPLLLLWWLLRWLLG